MASPIEYDSFDPRHTRAIIATTYDEYTRGEVVLPRRRLAVPAAILPRKTRDHAGRLEEAWAAIDADRAYFFDSVDLAGDMLEGQGQAAFLVATAVGRNATFLARVQTLGEGEKPKAKIARLFTHEFRQLVLDGTIKHLRVNDRGGIEPTNPTGLIVNVDHDRASYFATTGSESTR